MNGVRAAIHRVGSAFQKLGDPFTGLDHERGKKLLFFRGEPRGWSGDPDGGAGSSLAIPDRRSEAVEAFQGFAMVERIARFPGFFEFIRERVSADDGVFGYGLQRDFLERPFEFRPNAAPRGLPLRRST